MKTRTDPVTAEDEQIVRNAAPRMRLPAVVMATARQVAAVVGGSTTLTGRRVRDVLKVARSVASGWIRDAYTDGYRDGLDDAMFALGWDGSADHYDAIRKQAELRCSYTNGRAR